MKDIDSVPSNVQSARQEALLYVFEDNEAVIKMIMKGRSPTMRHVSRTHRVALDWLFDGNNLDPKIQIKCVDTKNQLADVLTKWNFTRDEWDHLFHAEQISHGNFTHDDQLDLTQAQDKISLLNVIPKGDLQHGVSAMPVKWSLQKIGKYIVKKFRLSRRKSERRKGPTLGIIVTFRVARFT